MKKIDQTAWVNIIGQMEITTKDNFVMDWDMEKDSFEKIKLAYSTMEIIKTIKNVAMDKSNMETSWFMWEISRITFDMVMASYTKSRYPNTRAIGSMIKKYKRNLSLLQKIIKNKQKSLCFIHL